MCGLTCRRVQPKKYGIYICTNPGKRMLQHHLLEVYHELQQKYELEANLSTIREVLKLKQSQQRTENIKIAREKDMEKLKKDQMDMQQEMGELLCAMDEKDQRVA